jgi:hypothetical protein
VPTVCDIVLRAAPDPSRRGWHACYRCTIDDPNWVSKDRHGVTPDKAPMNLGEILRMAGYDLPRAPWMDWQEGYVGELAQALLEAPPGQDKAILNGAIESLRGSSIDDLAIRWTLRDAVDRVSLTRAKANVFGLYV